MNRIINMPSLVKTVQKSKMDSIDAGNNRGNWVQVQKQ
jgi:hypothetical protein